MQEIGAAVEEGAQAYLARQFKTLAVFVVLVFGLLLLLPADTDRGVRWDAPASSSSARSSRPSIGYLGMRLAMKANVRVASAARNENDRDAGMQDRVPHRRRGRHDHRGPGPARRLRRRAALQGRRPQGARGLRLRRRAARDVHACRRRHLHQGGRRRRRPRRQGRGGHPRGRPAQRRHHRRQRRRQRRRLRRHGRRPVRVVRRDAGRRAHPRLGRLRRVRPGVPAAGPGHRRGHRPARRLHHQGHARRERAQRDQPRLLHRGRRLRRAVGHRRLRLPALHLRRPSGAPRSRQPQEVAALTGTGSPATRGWPRSSPSSSASCSPASSSG